MTYWTLEQALTWAMWRDGGRASQAADGHIAPALPKRAEELPSEDADALVRWLLENGEVEFVPMAHDDPHRGRERRWGTEARTGHMVCIEGWRERPGAPLCTDGVLHWLHKREEPILGLKEAKNELLTAMRDGRVHAMGEATPGQPVQVSAIDWLYADLRLSEDRRVGGYKGIEGYHGAGSSGATRLRLPLDEIKALWPAGERHPLPQPAESTPRSAHGPAQSKPKPRGRAKGYPFRLELIEAAVRPFGDDDVDYNNIKEIKDWLMEQTTDKKDGGIHEDTALRWAKKVDELIMGRERLRRGNPA